MKEIKFIKLVKNVKRVKLWYLVLAFLISLVVTSWLLRSNNLRMIKLREAVVVADQNDGDIEKALTELRSYVNSHMNTDLRSNGEFAIDEPPIQLVNQYNKAVKEAQKAASISGGNVSSQEIYTAAQNVCQSRGVPVPAIAQCVQDYIAERNAAILPETVYVPKELYSFDFISPKWSADFAGISLLVTFALGIVLSIKLIGYLAVRAILKSSS